MTTGLLKHNFPERTIGSQVRMYESLHMFNHAYQTFNHGVSIIYRWLHILKPGSTVHEIGCGNGRLCRILSDIGLYKVSGSDLAEGPYDRNGYEFLRSHIRDLRETHDYTLCFDVLEHLPEEEIPEALKTIGETTGQKAILLIPSYGSPPLHLTVRDGLWWKSKLEEYCPDFVWGSESFIRSGEKKVSLFIGERKEK